MYWGCRPTDARALVLGLWLRLASGQFNNWDETFLDYFVSVGIIGIGLCVN
jgi:hypothetical protein